MINKTVALGSLVSSQVVIDLGESKSNAIDLKGQTLVGVLIGDFTGTALSFEASGELDGTYVPVNDTSGSSISYTVAGDAYWAIDPKDTYGLNFIKLVSNATEVAERTLTLLLKGF